MIYDDLTAKLDREYELFLYALTGRYLSVVAPGVEITPSVMRSLEMDIIRLAKTFYEIAKVEVDNYLRPLLVDASDELVTTLNVRKARLIDGVRLVLVENVGQIKHQALVGKRNYLQLLHDAHGALGLLAQKKASGVDFVAHDAAGRKWHAAGLLRVMWRDFGYQSWLDFSFASITHAGGDLFEVIYADSSRNVVMSMSGQVGYLKLTDESRAKIFHPNATALVESYVPT